MTTLEECHTRFKFNKIALTPMILFTSRTGHGLGIEIHEPPYMVANSTTVLEEGMVFSIEPGIYMPGRFGVRLEEIVILRADGPEIFSELDRGVFVA